MAGDDKGDDAPQTLTLIIGEPNVEHGKRLINQAVANAEDVVRELPSPEFSDDDLARRFSAIHKNDLRYINDWGSWYRWDGSCYRRENTKAVEDLARDVCRVAAGNAKKAATAVGIASTKTLKAVEFMARSDRRHARSTEDFDCDPWLFNTPGGTVELQSGYLRSHSREDHITKCAAVAPVADHDCPLWLKFLDTITCGDKELQLFLQRMAGYSLTGSTREHALFFLYGTGANGKSVFINTLSRIMGDYAETAAMETFMVSHYDRHPTELASLRGARLVTAVETEEGRRWAEAKVKAVTGADPIKARFMRQDNFTFVPAFKLVVVGNHRPGLRNVDEAIRRRFHLVPFNATIAPAERDKDLADKLRAEWPGILRWMIDGCTDWLERGLRPPKAVADATDEYLEAEDALAQWLGEECATDAQAETGSTELFVSWRSWAERAAEPVGSLKRFSQALQSRGFHAKRKSGGRMALCGLRLQAPAKNSSDMFGSTRAAETDTDE